MNAFIMVTIPAMNRRLASTNLEILAAFATQDSLGMAPPVKVRKS